MVFLRLMESRSKHGGQVPAGPDAGTCSDRTDACDLVTGDAVEVATNRLMQ